MIFYGANTLTRGQKIVSDLPCDKCDKDTFVLANVYTSGYVFLIPFFGIVTRTMAFCTGCKKKMTLKRLNKKYSMGLTKDQMKDIESELYAQLPEEEMKLLKKRNIIGIITASISIAIIVVGLTASLLSS